MTVTPRSQDERRPQGRIGFWWIVASVAMLLALVLAAVWICGSATTRTVREIERRGGAVSARIPRRAFYVGTFDVIRWFEDYLPDAIQDSVRQIKWIHLHDTTVDDALAKGIGRMATLGRIALERCTLSGTALANLTRLPELSSLSLSNCVIVQPRPELIGFGAKLGILELRSTKTAGTGLAKLANGSNLKSLTFGGRDVEDDDLADWTGSPSLESVIIDGMRPGLRIWQALARCPSLRSLWLQESNVTDADLKMLSELQQLAVLGLPDCRQIGDVGLAHLATLTNVETISLEGTSVSGSGFQHLKRLPKLKTLSVARTPLTDDGCSHLASLTGLRELTLHECRRITDAGMHFVATIDGLVALDLSDTPVSLAGFNALERLENLKLLVVRGTAIPEKAASDLMTRRGGSTEDVQGSLAIQSF